MAAFPSILAPVRDVLYQRAVWANSGAYWNIRGCNINWHWLFISNTVTTDCVSTPTANSGCGVQSPDANSFGPKFNAAGGGYYAMERTTTGIRVWFWPRGSTSIPAALTSGATSIDTSIWGEATAYFPNTDCDIESTFGSLNIIINLTFCEQGIYFSHPGRNWW